MNEYSYQQGRHPYQHLDHSPASYTHDENSYQYRAVHTNAGLAQSSYEFNKGVIPGLAFGFPDANQLAQGQPSTSTGGSGQQRSGSLAIPVAAAQNEGLSEGELEDDDIYEPFADDEAGPSTDLRATEPGQERAASYSPAFSAGEVDESIDKEMRPSSTTFAVTKPDHNGVFPRNTIKEMSAAGQVRKVREDACAAISNLRLFDLPQQTYLDYNIDKSVLESLFRELGLKMPSQASSLSGPTITPVTIGMPSAAPKATAQAKPVSASGPDLNDASSKASSPKEGSESRKDRIARLLAAKGSRQAIASQPAVSVAPNDSATKEAGASASSTPNVTEPTATLPNKPSIKSLDKSKLLQQKMEALRKAREAKALSSSAQSDLAQQSVQQPASDTAVASAASTIVQPEPALTKDSSSSILPAAPRGHGVKRPVASDFDTPSLTLSKRQYGQPQETRQFLIHVSDDEDESDDDTEMDIETPEERSQSWAATAVESSLLRNHPPLSDSPYRKPKSPANTPGRSKSIIGSENLSKMYKNIEEMKRRIKEAEATKQAKTSRSGTPLDTPAQSNPDATSPSSAVIHEAVSRASPASSAAGSTPKETPTPTATDGASPQARPGPRRSLSRTAQERLTSIESERKNKELKMRIMRAKIAQMEKEMAASLQEEEALYGEGEDESLEDMPAESAVVGEAQPVDRTHVQPTQDGSESQLRQLDPPHNLPSPVIRTAFPKEVEAEEPDAPQTVLLNAEPEHALEAVAPQSTAEANETSDDNDAEMKDLTDQETSGSDNEDDQTSDSGTPSGAMTADAVAANAHSGAANDNLEDEGFSSESESAAEETDSDQDATEGEISDEDPDDTRSEANDQPEESVQHAEPPIQPEIEVTSAIEQASDIDELMGVKQPVNPTQTVDDTAEAVEGFRPYESPLSYFHAYRFHPEFQKAVKGGLRSLTYSNKIDVQKPMCPDELAGGECPRGPRCNFQHLGKISTPDDQILMQLGSYGAGEGDEQERFNNGLRTLLQELKGRESQDFAAISQAIIDYRAQFHGDKSKILPLGNIPI